MRTLLAILLLAALLPPRAAAGVVTVDPFNQTVETSHFRLQFDYDRPEMVWKVVYKDWNATRDVAGDEGQGREYWGQSLRGVNSPGFVTSLQLETHSWEVLDSFGKGATIRVTSTSPNQPPVTTVYSFLADTPYYVVQRTVHFSAFPDTASFQMYAVRVDFVNTYRALRWRDVTGAYLQRGYCYGGCDTPSWDGRWVEHVSVTNGSGFGIAQIYPASVPKGSHLVRGFGPETFAGWVARLTPAAYRDQDVTERLMVAFSRSPGDTTRLDSLWTVFNDGRWTLDAPLPTPGGRLRFAASPNPAAGPVRFAWRMGAAAHARLELLDAAGRLVALPFEGEAAPGEHALAWDGRGTDGRRVPPGVYLARLATPDAVATTRVVRVR